MAKIFCVANQKGGVGKTTTTVNLSAGLAKLKQRVLLVDLDPQGNATMGAGINKAGLKASTYEVMLGTSDIATARPRSEEMVETRSTAAAKSALSTTKGLSFPAGMTRW